MLKKILLGFVNKSIELLLPNQRRGAVALLVLNSPTSSEVLETATNLTDNFFFTAKQSFVEYIQSDKFAISLVEFLVANPDIEDYADFLYQEDIGFMSYFQKNFITFTYTTTPFLVCLNSEDYVFYQEYFNNELSEFEDFTIQSYMTALANLNANLIVQHSSDNFN
jgi:hypothetical protein